MEAGYRVYTQNGSVEFRKLEQAQAYHSEFGISEIEPFEIQEQQWDKAAYESELNAAHDAWFSAIILPLDYKSVEEIPLWIGDEEFDAEAAALKSLYRQSWKLLKAHLEEVTEATANVEAFIQSLPKFEP